MRAWFVRELSPFESHVAIAVLAVFAWVFVIVPLWRAYRSRPIAVFESPARVLSRNKSLTRWLAEAAIVLFVFAVGLWVGWHKEAISARLRRGPAEATIPPPSPATASTRAGAVLASSPSSLVDKLLKEAVEWRERGDMTTALARLDKALALDPKNMTALEEVARTYKSMGFSPTASINAATSHRLGSVFDLAQADSAANAASHNAASHKDAGRISEGSTFGITEVKTTETPDPDAETNLTLRIGIKKQPEAAVDHTKVKIQVFFYDTVDDKDIKLTDAKVNYEWLTPKHDWTNTNPEILSVTYLRPKHKAVPPRAQGGERRYLGYRVLAYYEDKLQAAQAEPARLLQLFPPSALLIESQAKSLPAPASTPAPSVKSGAPSASPSPIKTEVSYRFSVEKGAVTLADAKSGSVLATTTIERWGRPASTQDQLRHVALDVTAAVVAGNGGREHTVDPNSPVYTMDEATKAPAVTVTVEHGAIFFIQSDTYTNGRYEALIGTGKLGVPQDYKTGSTQREA